MKLISGATMYQQKGIFQVILLITCSVMFSGCASMFSKKDGEYDFFLENKQGEKIESTEAEEKTKGNKEAKLRARMALQQGDYDSALLYFVKALEHDDKDTETLIGIGNIHFVQGNNELAIFAFRMILAEDENNLDAKQGLGLSLIASHKYEEAREILLNALKDNPKREKIYNGLGVISDLQRYFDEAKWFYARALLINKNSAVAMTNLGYSYYLENKWDNAQKMYAKVLNIHPNHKQALLNLGLLQARKGELYDAQTSFERVLKKPQAYNELGYIMMLDKKYTMAEQLYQKAISASPSYFEKAHANLERLRELQAKRKAKITSLSAQ